MSPPMAFLAHALAAVEHAHQSWADLRDRDAHRLQAMPRQRPVVDDKFLVALARCHSNALDACRDMQQGGHDALPVLWRRFLARYDEYLDAMRDARNALSQETQASIDAGT